MHLPPIAPRDSLREALCKSHVGYAKACDRIDQRALQTGIRMALTCDIRISSSLGKFAAAFSRISLVPGVMTFYLPRIIGLARSAEILYTGRQVLADEALSIGLVNQVVPPEELDEAVNTMAVTLANAAPIAIQLTRRELYRGLEGTFDGQLEMELYHQKFLQGSMDSKEGPRAFMEKREPDFQGR